MATEILDQECDVSSNYNIFPAGQTFKPTLNNLTKIAIKLSSDAPSAHSFLLELYSSYPPQTSTFITSIIKDCNVTNNWEWYECVFPSSVVLNPEQEYFFIISFPSSGLYYAGGYKSPSGPYPRGYAVLNYYVYSAIDMAFRTYGLTEAPTTAIINVNSIPTGAGIYLDGIYLGNTNSSYVIAIGTHTLKLTLVGYQDYIETFSIASGETKTFNITLSPLPPPPPPNTHILKLNLSGYRDYIETFSISQGETKTFNVNLSPIPKTIIIVNSIPTGANIYLDNANIGKTNSSYEIQAGSHTLKLTLAGYQDYIETFTISQGETKTFNVTPIPKTIITLNSIPTGANIYLNNNYFGKTNSSYEIQAGSHTLKLTLPGYQDYTETFSISQGETKTFNITLSPLPIPIINVNSVPTGANIYLDNVNIGKTNSSYETSAGSHTLKLTLSGYRDYIETFSISQGETKTFNVNLSPIPIPKTIIIVNSIPTGANIYLDNANIGKTNSSYEIQAGSHTLKLTLSGYQDYTETFSISSGATKTFNIILILIPPSDIRFYEVIYPVETEAYKQAKIYSKIKNYGLVAGTVEVDLINRDNGNVLASYTKTLSKNYTYTKYLYTYMPNSIDLPGRILKLKLDLYQNGVVKESKSFDVILKESKGDFILAEPPAAVKYRYSAKVYVTMANIGAYSDYIFFRIIDNDTNGALTSTYYLSLSVGRSYRTYKNFTMPNRDVNFRVEVGHKEGSLYVVDEISPVYTIKLI